MAGGVSAPQPPAFPGSLSRKARRLRAPTRSSPPLRTLPPRRRAGPRGAGGLLAAIGVGLESLGQVPVDLSEGGAKVLLTRRLATGTKVHVRLEIEKFGDALSASGIVRWCHQSAKNPSAFFAGIMFTDLDPLQKKKISAMREWFTSSKCLKLRRAKAREADPFA